MSQKIQFQEGDHGPESSPSEETPGQNRKQNQIETPKKPIPVVLPVLPTLPTLPTPKSNSTDPIMNKTVREKPRERERCPRYLMLFLFIFIIYLAHQIIIKKIFVRQRNLRPWSRPPFPSTTLSSPPKLINIGKKLMKTKVKRR